MPNNVVFPASMPYDEINIIDQSSYSDASTQTLAPFIPSGPTAFIPFISPKGYGKDKTLQYMSESMLSKFGKPNLKKYGLSLYLAKRFVAGGGTLLGMRVTSNDMHYSNIILVANVTADKKIAKFTTTTNSITGEVEYHPVFKCGNKEYVFDEILLTKTNDFSTISTERTVNGKNELVPLNQKKEDNLEYPEVTVTIDGVSTTLSIKLDVDGNVSSLEKTVEDPESSTDTYALVVGSGMYVYYTLKSINGDTAADLDSIKSSANEVGDNENTFAIALISSTGAGEYGNSYKFRITPDASTNAVIESNNGDAFCYRFIDSENGASLDSPFSFTFNDDYLYGNESMAIDEVFETYSKNIVMQKLNGYDKFMGLLKTKLINTGNVANPIDDVNKLDILFGTNIDPSVYYVDFIEDAEDESVTIKKNNVDLSRSIGISLQNGTDPKKEFSYKDDPFADVIADAYNGKYDDMIYDQIRYPYQYLFAPSVDPKVTAAIHNLTTVNRKGTRASYFVVGGTTDVPKTYDDARISRTSLPDDSWKEDVTPEWARCTDPYTGKKTFFPSVYWTAYTYPYHWLNRKGKALAGPSHAVWSGFDIGTVTPRTASDAQRVANHNARMNTMVEDGIGTASLYEQITSSTYTSALSEINNAQILVDMVRMALKIANDSRWSDLSDNEVGEYKSSVESTLKSYFNTSIDNIAVVANRESSNGAGANRIYCRINVKFKNIFKGVTYDFYILAN